MVYRVDRYFIGDKGYLNATLKTISALYFKCDNSEGGMWGESMVAHLTGIVMANAAISPSPKST